MRERLTFLVEGARCAASLDRADGASGLLIVSGGNEVHSGAHRGMAWMAAQLSAAGYPVLRFDRRGVGDSEGSNGGFESSLADIAAATALFRIQCPGMQRVIAFGNCDAATALLLHHHALPLDRLILANPWTIDSAATEDLAAEPGAVALPNSAAIRARYAEKLKNPAEWLRLLRGGVNLPKLVRGLRAAGRGQAPSQIALQMRHAFSRSATPMRILLARRDATALAFAAHWDTTFARGRGRIALHTLDSASHSFADDESRAWLLAQLHEALAAD